MLASVSTVMFNMLVQCLFVKLAVLQDMLCKPDIASLSSFISRLEIQIFLILFSFMEHSMKHQSQLLNPQIKMKRSCYETVVLELTGNW